MVALLLLLVLFLLFLSFLCFLSFFAFASRISRDVIKSAKCEESRRRRRRQGKCASFMTSVWLKWRCVPNEGGRRGWGSGRKWEGNGILVPTATQHFDSMLECVGPGFVLCCSRTPCWTNTSLNSCSPSPATPRIAAKPSESTLSFVWLNKTNKQKL